MISEDHCVVLPFDSLNERRRSRRRRTRTRQTPSSRRLFSWLLLSSSSSSLPLSLPMLWLLLWLWSVALSLLSCTCCVGAFTTQFSFQTPQQRHVQSAILTTKLRIEPTISRTRITTTTTILQSSTMAETTTTLPSDRSLIGLNGDDDSDIMPSETLQRQPYGNEAVRVGVLLLNLGGPERTEDVEGGLLKHTTRLELHNLPEEKKGGKRRRRNKDTIRCNETKGFVVSVLLFSLFLLSSVSLSLGLPAAVCFTCWLIPWIHALSHTLSCVLFSVGCVFHAPCDIYGNIYIYIYNGNTFCIRVLWYPCPSIIEMHPECWTIGLAFLNVFICVFFVFFFFTTPQNHKRF